MQDDARDDPDGQSKFQTESLSERFSRLCDEADFAACGNSTEQTPALPGLTDDEARFITRNDAGEVYLTPVAVAEAGGEKHSSVISAFKKALAHAFGDENESETDWETFPNLAMEAEVKDAESDDMTFRELAGYNRLEPMPELDAFDWEKSKSKAVLDNFVAKYERDRRKREEEAEAEATTAMARAAASGAKPSRPTNLQNAANMLQRHKFNSDPVVWAAQEEAAASAVLRDLRAVFSRVRKGSSRAPPDGSPVWSLLSQSNSKLKPEAAAEMARAKVAAAAAAAAMREDEPEPGPDDSLSDLKQDCDEARTSFDSLNPGFDTSGDTLDSGEVSSTFRLNRRFEANNSRNAGLSQPVHGDAKPRFKNGGKEKRVQFVEGTVFGKR